MQVSQQTWAIFCKIVDNYGDIGVCWRLAKQLAHEYAVTQTARPEITVTLYIDELQIANNIIPALKNHPDNIVKIVENVTIKPLKSANDNEVANVVIETFSCGLPEAYVQKMQMQRACWINLEYLSAEKWVEGFHGKASIHPTMSIPKYFFFPGFNQKTGGLLREHTLLASRDAFDSNNFLNTLAKPCNTAPFENAINISLFCYSQANLKTLINALCQQPKDVNIWLPYNHHLTDFFANYNNFKYTIGEVIHIKNIKIFVLPFLSQTDYDHLLWSCNLNFVRGEDSWIRAIWAAKPFIWQPYIQSEDTHLEKLNAFLQTHYPLTSTQAAIAKIMHNAHLSWSNVQIDSVTEQTIWLEVLENLDAIKSFQAINTKKLAEHPDLASELVTFAQNSLKQ